MPGPATARTGKEGEEGVVLVGWERGLSRSRPAPTRVRGCQCRWTWLQSDPARFCATAVPSKAPIAYR
jgi:hypothetical protein